MGDEEDYSEEEEEFSEEELIEALNRSDEPQEEKRQRLEEINEISINEPSENNYQDRFANGLPDDYEPLQTGFRDERIKLSYWFPKIKEADIPTITTHIFELQDPGGKEMLEELDITPMEILMLEEPTPVLKFFGKPDLNGIKSAVEEMDNKAFVRGSYKSSTNLGHSGNYINVNSTEAIAHTLMHQLQDRIMSRMPFHDPVIIREQLDLDFYPEGRPTLHPEVRFFIEEGEVLYHFPRVDKDTFASCDNGVEHYTRVVNSINENITQLYDWALQAAQVFDASWSLDFVMDTDGNWYATDMALNGMYYSEDKDRWHNLSEHQEGSPYNLEEQFGDDLPKPAEVD